MNLTTRAVLTAAASAAVAIGAAIGEVPLIAVLGVLAVIFAVGWSSLMQLPSRGGSTLVVSLTAVGALACVALTQNEPWLRFLPVVLAFGVFLAFINEMLRPVPRTNLIDSLFGTVTGIVVTICGAGWLAAFRIEHGLAVVMISAAALAAASAAGALKGPRWLVVVATFALGTAAGVVTAHFLGATTLLTGLLQGALAGLVISALHALVHRLPDLTNRRSAASMIVLPILALGVLVYVAGRLVF